MQWEYHEVANSRSYTIVFVLPKLEMNTVFNLL
jgi:hypothetical protein